MKKLIFACIGIFLFACNNNLQEEVAISEKDKAKVSKKTEKIADAIDFLNEAFVDDTMPSTVPYYHASDAQFCQTKTKSRF